MAVPNPLPPSRLLRHRYGTMTQPPTLALACWYGRGTRLHRGSWQAAAADKEATVKHLPHVQHESSIQTHQHQSDSSGCCIPRGCRTSRGWRRLYFSRRESWERDVREVVGGVWPEHGGGIDVARVCVFRRRGVNAHDGTQHMKSK